MWGEQQVALALLLAFALSSPKPPSGALPVLLEGGGIVNAIPAPWQALNKDTKSEELYASKQ